MRMSPRNIISTTEDLAGLRDGRLRGLVPPSLIPPRDVPLAKPGTLIDRRSRRARQIAIGHSTIRRNSHAARVDESDKEAVARFLAAMPAGDNVATATGPTKRRKIRGLVVLATRCAAKGMTKLG